MMASPPTNPERTGSECQICGGTGWNVVQVVGKGRVATRCDCFIARRTEHVLRSTGIPPRYASCTLANFESDSPGADTSLAGARLAAGRFVEEYSSQSEGLLLIGPVGTGKTHLAVGIIRELVHSATARCLFCDYRELLKEIQNSNNPNVEATELQILSPVFDVELLVLDDVGAVKPTEWVWDTVSSIINNRYNEKKTTIITTNYPDLPERRVEAPMDSFSRSRRAKDNQANDTLGDRITDRMRSRLHEMCRVVELKGNDFRTGLQRKPVRAVSTHDLTQTQVRRMKSP